MQHNKIRNLEFKKFPNHIVTKTNNYQMARTAIKISMSCQVKEVKLVEYNQNVLIKYAFIKRKNNDKA